MSCHIRLSANIQDVGAIRRCLFPTDDQRGSDTWLQQCEVSVSPIGDLIVIANERKIVVLSAKWNSHTSMYHFVISYSGSIHNYDKVKGVLCLPIVRLNGNSMIEPDWTCILVAYDSGYVRFYTESCELLLEEQFHNENITSMKCQSQHSPRPDMSPELRPEEIYVQYQSVLCVLSGPQLFPYLQNCRSHLAKEGDMLELPLSQLTPKKLGFQDQSVINDSAVVGLNLSSTFDHLLTASNCGGFDTKYRAMPPHNTLVLAAGSKPFLGYHYALQGVAQPVLSDLAKAVTNKLKSALPGWLMGSKAQPEKQMSLTMQLPDSMGCRFGLCDLRRTATDIILSPDRKLAVICDALGRVLLVDSFRGVVLRMFKGYRDAQCAFIQVPDERKSKHRLGNKVAHFLVIYSPKKGTIEIFSVQQGSRVVTFTASKHSKLVYIGHGLMGFVATSKSKYICQFTTVFIDSDGQIKEFLVPFHFALEEKNNKRARDIHLYKKLRQLIKSREAGEEKLLNEISNTCAELKTMEIKLQLVEMLITNKNISAAVSLQAVLYFLENPVDNDNNLKLLCQNIRYLLQLYQFVTKSSVDDKLDEENGNIQFKTITLNLEAKEMKNLQKLLDLSTISDNNELPKVHVSFSDNSVFSPAEFLSTFDLSRSGTIALKSNIDESVLFKTSEVLFKHYITGELKDFGQLKHEIEKSKIVTRNLFDLLINYWVNRSLYINLSLEKELNNLCLLIYTLVQTADEETVVTEYSQISQFWSKIRIFLANSSRPFPALMAAILCKIVAQKLNYEEKHDESTTSLDDCMEVLSQEDIEWSLLIGKLEDMSRLNIILGTKVTLQDPTMPKLQHDRVAISLKYILEKGKGSVSELVAQWLTASGIDPQELVIYDKSKTEDSEEFVNRKPFEQLSLLREQFPYSLESSMLLANMTWEYALAWQKDIQDLGHLEAALKCLNCIQNVQVKQGLYQLVWNTHLKIVNESACKLINKVGKVPKERLCRQDTGLSNYQICLFIEISTKFFEVFLDAVQDSCDVPKPALQFENIWDNGSQSLAELAVRQREVNYDLLHLHYQLSLVLQMIATFSVKQTKPVNSLFEASLANLFFTDLQRKVQINWNKSDIKINSSREQFLHKIISASLESVTVNESGKIHSSEHIIWMSKCILLGRFWNLDADMLRRYQIAQLYTAGFDSLAEELIPAVNDIKELGVPLLDIAAKRMLQFLTSSPSLSENYAALSPLLTNYMKSLDDDWCAPSSLSGISNLTIQAMCCLNDLPEYKLARFLLDTCNTIEESSL